jgi:hypothetical protein
MERTATIKIKLTSETLGQIISTLGIIVESMDGDYEGGMVDILDANLDPAPPKITQFASGGFINTNPLNPLASVTNIKPHQGIDRNPVN